MKTMDSQTKIAKLVWPMSFGFAGFTKKQQNLLVFVLKFIFFICAN
jgi:hypothetical protein